MSAHRPATASSVITKRPSLTHGIVKIGLECSSSRSIMPFKRGFSFIFVRVGATSEVPNAFLGWAQTCLFVLSSKDPLLAFHTLGISTKKTVWKDSFHWAGEKLNNHTSRSNALSSNTLWKGKRALLERSHLEATRSGQKTNESWGRGLSRRWTFGMSKHTNKFTTICEWIYGCLRVSCVIGMCWI